MKHATQTETKTTQLRTHRNSKKTQLQICTRFKREIPFFCFSFGHFRNNDANRNLNDAILKHATQTETKKAQLENHRNFKKT